MSAVCPAGGQLEKLSLSPPYAEEILYGYDLHETTLPAFTFSTV